MKKYLFLILSVFIISESVLFSQKNLTLISRLKFPGRSLAGVWHYVDSTDIEYAIVGTSTAISIVDISDPATPLVKFEVPVPASIWQELKTWGKYAYCGTEGGGGITIIDLSKLPASITSKVWKGDGPIKDSINNSHTVATDNGYLYIFGAGGIKKMQNAGAIICSLADPWNPTYVGNYNSKYVHDGYVRNDTLYTSEIYAGQFAAVDVTNKASPALINFQETPGKFNHNVWLSDNSKYLFAADERPNVPLASFDISDIFNIKLLDKYYTEQMPTREVHNVRVLNDYLVNACYGSQVTIVDAHKPDNLVEIAHYKTGTALCWDVTPYAPSGLIIATDKDSGMYIFSTNYHRACYLEGEVRDSISNAILGNVKVELLSTPIQDSTNALTGKYKTGSSDAGNYSVRFSKNGYYSRTINGVSLGAGNVTLLNVRLLIDSLGIGINEPHDISEIFLYPNPAKNVLNISWKTAGNKPAILALYDVLGVEKYSTTLNSRQTVLNIEKLSPGIYLYSIKDENGNVLKEDKLLVYK